MSIFDKKPGFDPNLIDEHEQKIKQEAEMTREERAMMEMEAEQHNPFDIAQYQQFNKAPDLPVNYSGNMVEILLSDDTVPEEIRNKYWFVFNKDNVLTFLDNDRKKQKLLNMDIMKIDLLNNTPYYNYNFDQEYELSLIRNVFETKLDRALGTREGVKNERTTLQSQFTEVKNISENSSPEVGSSGFFKKLLGRR
jgi:hypothetical protein